MSTSFKILLPISYVMLTSLPFCLNSSSLWAPNQLKILILVFKFFVLNYLMPRILLPHSAASHRPVCSSDRFVPYSRTTMA